MNLTKCLKMKKIIKIFVIFFVTGCCNSRLNMPEMYPVEFKPVKDGYFISKEDSKNLLYNITILKEGYTK